MENFKNTSEDPMIRKRFSENIMDILRPLSEAEMPKLDWEDAASEYSTLSEPFSDLDESYILLDQRKKKPGDDEGDEMLLNQFTPEFRRVYDEMIVARQEGREESEPDFLTDEGERDPGPEQALLLDDPGQFSPKFQEFIEDLLKKCELNSHLEEKKKRDAQKKKERRVRRGTSSESFGIPDTDSLSGVWRMLDAVSVDNGFPISHNYYNLYDDRRFEWLTRDEVPWDEIEASKKKCEQWLKMSPSKPDTTK
ncbi:uncharacterized protein LOC135706344 [Ochlerotatus camptorhynchus]|uniref:uncharacterized protein LOC135706344 n=1 Tax=Ochlerotatus camptorhynchus TaxID=644619 RepID=UPI0031E4177A